MLTPIKHEKLPLLTDPAQHNEILASYAKAIQGIAEKRGHSFVGMMFSVPQAGRTTTVITDNGIHLNAQGYEVAANIIASGLGWEKHVPSASIYETLRQVILRKNEFFFYRSRPANMAYIFGFRRGEQGRNAVEMPQFDQ